MDNMIFLKFLVFCFQFSIDYIGFLFIVLFLLCQFYKFYLGFGLGMQILVVTNIFSCPPVYVACSSCTIVYSSNHHITHFNVYLFCTKQAVLLDVKTGII